jgi:phage portal protein BeeE
VAKIGAGLGQGLAGWWPGLRIEADLDGVAALSDERAALWDRVAAADFLTGEEKRALLGIA